MRVHRNEPIGIVHPMVDAHTLGMSSIAQLLEDCGYTSTIATEEICRALEAIEDPKNAELIRQWIVDFRIRHIGFSFRLDPDSGVAFFGRFLHALRSRQLLQETGGPIRGLFFAGLPSAGQAISSIYGDRVQVFWGDETATEALLKLGVAPEHIPPQFKEEEQYDAARLEFGRSLLRQELHRRPTPVDRSGSVGFGSMNDTLVARVAHGTRNALPPLMRAHVGPYNSNREAAVTEYLDWCRRLARSGYLDILSIGTSQLTQEAFGEDWADRQNGGGVPINSVEEYKRVYEASRPMLVRTYAGTSRIPEMAHMHEGALNIAWHALSFWWFSKIDGRGPNGVAENLREHFETLSYIAKTGKPFEPNIPHHFAFRGADDATYVASGVLAARCAKRMGVPVLVLQNMLNTPRATSGIHDLAKARVMLSLVRELADSSFQVIYQPRAGLDYFSSDPQKAMTQLAAVSALMDDVEPSRRSSPEVIHVVSYSEGFALADPEVVDESVRITRAAIDENRRLRAAGRSFDPDRSTDVKERTEALDRDVRALLAGMEAAIPDLYSPAGLYTAMWAGFLPTPYLWECRDEFKHAIRWRTRPICGSIKVVDEVGMPIQMDRRVAESIEVARKRNTPAQRALTITT